MLNSLSPLQVLSPRVAPLLPYAIVTVACLVALPLWRAFKHYRSQTQAFKNIPGPPRSSWITGNLEQLFSPHCQEFLVDLATNYPSVSVLKGFLGDKQLHVYDPLALHHIFQKEQNIYGKRELDLVLFTLLFGKGVGSTEGEHHRKQRKVLNPVFAINRMRELLPIFYEIVHKFRDDMKNEVVAVKGGTDLDILHWTTRIALEVVGQAGLGYSFDSNLQKSSKEYHRALKDVFPVLASLVVPQQILTRAVKIGSARFRRFSVYVMHLWKRLRRAREVIDVLETMSIEILESKKAGLDRLDNTDQIGEGKDIITTLLRANATSTKEDRLPESEVLAQIATFILAGSDTTSSALSRIMHDLAMHPDVQEKLRQELCQAIEEEGERISYDTLAALPYLDAVSRESMRLHAPAPFISRTTKQDVIMPLSNPFRGLDGQEVKEIFIPKNTNIVAGLMASNCNPALWGPDAYEYRPDRWLSTLPEAVRDARIPGIYSSLMTFGGGKHGCIGFQFSEMEIKVVLAAMLPTLRFGLSEQKLVWRITTGASPTVEGSNTPQLPLKVTMVN